MHSKAAKCFTYWVEIIVVLAQLTFCTIYVPVAGDLTPQGEEENSQTHKTQEHGPGQGEQNDYLLFSY